jgi:hypothetical protein
VERITVYVSIGNSDDKLTQNEWAEFYAAVDDLVGFAAARVHGRWVSPATDPWQNACWCVELDADDAENLRKDLPGLAFRYRQVSIAWAEAQTTFIEAAK